jgi:myo-inositol-1(or 4)-monophosphatase
MQSFPGFKGVPEADRLLANAIDAAARRAGGAPARPRPPGAPGLEAELALAVRLAREAGEVLRRRRGPGLEIGAKAGGEVVTAADMEVNDRIRAALAQAYPQDGLFLEESPDSPARLGRRRVWIVDPLDATSDYAGGGDQHAVSIGLAVGGEPVLGVVYNPAREELVAGYRGVGVTLNGAPVRTSAREALRGARLTASPKEWRRSGGGGAVAALPVHPVSSMAYKLARVAAGLSDGAFSTAPRKEWGTCAGVALVLAAGGCATLLDGSPIRFNRAEARQPLGMAASGRRLHAPLLAALAAVAAGSDVA